MSEPKIRLAQIAPSVSGTDQITGNVIISNNLTVGGNLTVTGNTTVLNVETLLIEDNDIVLNSNTVGSPTLNSSITVNRGSSTNTFLRWNEGTDSWGWSDNGSTFNAFEDLVKVSGDTMTGQLNISSGGLLVTGNVGIGTSDIANGKLTLFGDSADPFNTPINILKLLTTSGNQGSSLRIDMHVGAARPYIEALVTGPNSGSGAALAFATPSATGVGTERMRITTDGNVGIGTTNPGAKLHSYTTTSQTGLLITGDSGNEQLVIQRYTNTNEQLILGFHSNDYAKIQAIEQLIAYRPLALNPDGGNVGIGTTNPGATLHVQGSGFFNEKVLCSRTSQTSSNSDYTSDLDSYGGSTYDGYYAVGRPGYSSAVLQFDTGGSTGTIQFAFTYNASAYRRNKTDNITWSAWRQVD